MLSQTLVLLLTCTAGGLVDASRKQPTLGAEAGWRGEVSAAQVVSMAHMGCD